MKKSSVEGLIQKWLNSPKGSMEEKMLLALIKRAKPDFKMKK